MGATATTSVALVVQRYGEGVVGGAESHARALAERFVRDLGWRVDVVTTTATDYRSWRNAGPEGTQTLNGVAVHRFHSLCRRWPLFGGVDRVLRGVRRLLVAAGAPDRWVMGVEAVWFWAQGPANPRLLRFLRKEAPRFDAVIFFTYLYFPTVFGLPAVADKALLVPTAHDEPPFHFRRVARVLASARALLVNGEVERALIASLWPHGGAPRMEVAGLGIDATPLRPQAKGEPPYFLYLGRIGKGKGVDELVAWFLAADIPATLLLAGQREEDFALPRDPRVSYLGYVPEARKAELIRGALAVVNPSPLESLSLIVLEAMALEVPVLVNGACDVLAYYARQTETVFDYRGEGEFAAAAQDILRRDWADQENAARLSRSREWALSHYAWEKVLKTYEAVVAELRGGKSGTSAGRGEA